MVLPFLTLYLTVDRKFSPGKAGLALTVYGIAAIIIAPLAGRVSDRLGSLVILKLSMFLTGLILFLIPFVSSLYGILAITGIWAFAAESFRPPSMALIGRLTGPAQRKMAFALSRLAINLGMSIGPVIGGFLAMRSFRSLFYVDGSTAILAGVLIAVMPWRTQGQVVTSPGDPETANAEPGFTQNWLCSSLTRPAFSVLPLGDVAGRDGLLSVARSYAFVRRS
jgi:MFS family permease